MVNLPLVGPLISTRDEGGVIHKLQQLDGLVTGGAAVGVQVEEWREKNNTLRGTGADGLRVGDVFHQLPWLLPIRQEVCDPLQVESGRLDELQQSREEGVKTGLKIPQTGSWGEKKEKTKRGWKRSAEQELTGRYKDDDDE